MKQFIVLVITIYFFSGSVDAQNNILNANTPNEIGKSTEEQIYSDNDKPLPYGFIDDRDVLWSRNVWEFIDLDERVNFPLYYPIDTMNIGSERRSLFDVILKNIKNGNITEVYYDSYFQETKSLKQIENSLIFTKITDLGKILMNELPEEQRFIENVEDYEQYVRTFRIDAGDVEGWKIRGVWYIDKRQADLRYRIIGICPVTADVQSNENSNSDSEPVDLFWIWYPGAREILHEAKAFNRKNSSQPISYDHLLNSRRFSAMIYKDDNVHGDRGVTDYIRDNALMQLLESERLKEQIRNIEIDLWNY